MWDQWKIFDKMTEDLNYDFWGPKWHGKWASEANIQHTSKSRFNWHVNPDWCETSGKVLRKWPKTMIWLILGTKVASGPKIGPLRPIFSTHLKSSFKEHVKPYWCEIGENFFEKVTKDQHFDWLWGPKWPKNWTFETHIVHNSDSCSN